MQLYDANVTGSLLVTTVNIMHYSSDYLYSIWLLHNTWSVCKILPILNTILGFLSNNILCNWLMLGSAGRLQKTLHRDQMKYMLSIQLPKVFQVKYEDQEHSA